MPKIIDHLAQKLTDEARRQVLQSGYSSLNIRTVARNCGVSVGAVYNYFPSKDALVAGFLVEDWMESLERIRRAAESQPVFSAALEAIHRELCDFLARYGELFRSASASVPAPPRQYHRLLRSQISQILLPMCPDPFTADFAAEALLAWTAEGVPLPQLKNLLEKTMQ